MIELRCQHLRTRMMIILLNFSVLFYSLFISVTFLSQVFFSSSQPAASGFLTRSDLPKQQGARLFYLFIYFIIEMKGLLSDRSYEHVNVIHLFRLFVPFESIVECSLLGLFPLSLYNLIEGNRKAAIAGE